MISNFIKTERTLSIHIIVVLLILFSCTETITLDPTVESTPGELQVYAEVQAGIYLSGALAQVNSDYIEYMGCSFNYVPQDSGLANVQMTSVEYIGDYNKWAYRDVLDFQNVKIGDNDTSFLEEDNHESIVRYFNLEGDGSQVGGCFELIPSTNSFVVLAPAWQQYDSSLDRLFNAYFIRFNAEFLKYKCESDNYESYPDTLRIKSLTGIVLENNGN